MRNIVIVVLAFSLFIGCTSDEENNTENDIEFFAKVNGEDYTPISARLNVVSGNEIINAFGDVHAMMIGAPEGTQPGTYPDPGSGAIISFTTTAGPPGVFISEREGELTITENSDTFLRGTFFFNVYSPGNSQNPEFSITEGQFNIEK